MDSPIRQLLKRNDYQRHKLFRKMKRRLKAKREQEKELAEKELRRKLRMPKYADGKLSYENRLTDLQYYAIMEKVAEENNPKWNKWRLELGEKPLSVNEDYLRILNDNSYDYRSYYNKYPQSAANADTHWPDEFKTVWHPSFSDESIYSGKKSQYNPKGIVGGHWYGDSFVPSVALFIENNIRFGKYADGKPAYTYTKSLDNVGVDEEGNLRDPEVPRARGSVLLPEVTISHPDLKDMAGRYSIVSNDAITVVNGRPVNMHLKKSVDEGAKKLAAWAQEHPYLNMTGVAANAVPLAVAAAPAVIGGGELAAAALANPYIDAATTSAFAGHGLNHWINEGIDGYGDAFMTALELTPLGRVAKPVWNAVKPTRNFIPTPESNMSGVRFAYNRNPELANIGTLEDYNNYLKTVFPESKVKDINYHMGPKGLQELKPSTGEVWNTNPGARGIYVTPDKSYAQRIRKYTTTRLENPSTFTYIKRNLIPGGWDKANDAFTDIYPVIIDTKNPLLTKGTWTWGIKDKKYQSIMDDYDAIVNSGPKWYQNAHSMPETIIPKTEQSLILGSDADVAGFRKFMSNPQITAENAASMTPEQWTAAQDAAIARGDMAEAQRLRDLHFQVSAPTPYISKGVYLPSGNRSALSQTDYYNGNNDLVTLYHSSVDADNLIKEGFDGVEHGLGRTKGEAKGTIFASANPDYAADYSNLYIQKGLSTPDKVGLVELKVPRGAGAFEGNEVRLRPEHIKEITKSTYEKTPWLRWLKTRKTNNDLFNIKSADAVTYDKNGVRIPLGLRDNFNINDIRYGLLPFLGLGAAGTLLSAPQLGYKDGKPAYTYTKPLDNVSVDEEGNLRDPEVPSAKGSVLLPEITVTTRDPRKYVSAFNGNLEYLDDMIGFVPVAGDLNDAVNAGIAAYKGDYLLAGMLGAGLLLPNILEKPLKYTLKFGGKGLLKLGSKLGVADYVWNDLADEGLKAVWDAKRNGYYAFTNRGHEKLGRKIWNDKFVGRVNDIIDRANNLEKQQFNKRMYGQYSDRFTNAPEYMYVGKPDVVGIAQHEVGKDAVLRASNNTKSPNFVLYDPRMIRKNADFRVDPEPVSVWFDTNVQKQDLDYGGKYSDSKKQITIPMHTKANSGFLNKHLTEPDKVFDWLIGHEYTHHLQNLPQFALNLRLSVDGGNWTSYYTALPNDYVFGQHLNPFHAIYDRSNNRLNEAMSSEKAGFKKEIDPNLEVADYGKYGEHNASPDEAVADLRAFQIAGYSDEEIYDYMFREYGMSADDVDLARAMGYKHGKAPGIHIKPENRGKFTALKKRTGHSASWFKEHGTPALKKMATFALNSRKWSKR